MNKLIVLALALTSCMYSSTTGDGGRSPTAEDFDLGSEYTCVAKHGCGPDEVVDDTWTACLPSEDPDGRLWTTLWLEDCRGRRLLEECGADDPDAWCEAHCSRTDKLICKVDRT